MKLLSSPIEKIEIIAFILGFVAGIYMLMFPARHFFTWHPLPTPPEPVDKIIMAHLGDVIVRTISNNKLLCNIDHEEECWTEVDYDPLDLGKILCVGNCPNKHTMQMMEATVLVHSFVVVSTRYSLNDDGIIYIKQKGVIYPDGYMIGAIVGGFCAFIAFLGKDLIFTILDVFKRGRSGVT